MQFLSLLIALDVVENIEYLESKDSRDDIERIENIDDLESIDSRDDIERIENIEDLESIDSKDDIRKNSKYRRFRKYHTE